MRQIPVVSGQVREQVLERDPESSVAVFRSDQAETGRHHIELVRRNQSVAGAAENSARFGPVHRGFNIVPV
jgi:hypothetical protein